jgi:ATP-binding cassette subfamily F protein 3
MIKLSANTFESVEALKAALLSEAQRIADDDVLINQRMGAFGAALVPELRRVSPLADNGELRSFLSRFLFFGDDVFKRVGDLSGGEKGRLALAKLIYSRKNVLILDEPTNHLDIPSREALEAALDEFDGTIIAVSHDRFFLDKIATQILAFEGDEVDVFNGNYTEYHDWREKKISDISATGKTVDGPVTAANVLQTPGAPPASMSKNERERMMKRVAAIEAEIPVLEEELAALTEELGLAEVVADYARLRDATKRFEAKEKQIRGLYEEWELYVEHQPSSG